MLEKIKIYQFAQTNVPKMSFFRLAKIITYKN